MQKGSAEPTFLGIQFYSPYEFEAGHTETVTNDKFEAWRTTNDEFDAWCTQEHW
jgi:hypothetical protein